MRYDKLVRDKMPERIRQNGGLPVTHVADEAEYWAKLKAKLQEEAAEFVASESPEELADLFEVIDAIMAHKSFDSAAVRAIQARKAAERGGFRDRIILEES